MVILVFHVICRCMMLTYHISTAHAIMSDATRAHIELQDSSTLGYYTYTSRMTTATIGSRAPLIPGLHLSYAPSHTPNVFRITDHL